jgi:HEAT repeat protein
VPDAGGVPGDADDGARRTAVVMAGHLGDEAVAREGLDDPNPAVRAAALGAMARLGRLEPAALATALHDAAPVVRRRACELVPGSGTGPTGLVERLADADASVVEAACFALGELAAAAGGPPVATLAEVARGHADPLCREAAVAALGAIGDPAGLPAVLEATRDKPAVRRRAVLALAPFDEPEVDDALRRALSDRDWQVRQAAEDLGATP